MRQSLQDAATEPVLLPPYWREHMLRNYVLSHIPSHPLPATLEQWERERAELRERLRVLIGLDQVEHSGPPEVIERGVLRRAGYSIRKILLCTLPGMEVPALLYVPEGLKGRAPAMVSIGGHNYAQGKAHAEVQARAVNLCLRGCIVLAYDYPDCGERNTGPNRRRGDHYGGRNDHRLTAFSYGRLTPAALEVLDGMQAIGYLESRPDVDPRRIGFTGESGGGYSTMMVSALDERVALSVPVSYISSFGFFVRNGRTYGDWHQCPYGILGAAEVHTLLAMVAPRPLLVVSSRRGTDDQEFPWEEAESSFEKARAIYELYGAADRIAHFESSKAHGYQLEKREKLYAWVDRWLLGGHTALGSSEKSIAVEPDEELECRPSPGALSVAGVYRRHLSALPPELPLPDRKDQALAFQNRLRAELRPLLALSAEVPPARATVDHERVEQGVRLRFMVFETEERVLVTGTLFEPQPGTPSRLVLSAGRSLCAAAVEGFLESGSAVLMVDPREGGGRWKSPLGAWAWFMGKPPLGMAVHDLLSIGGAIGGGYPDGTTLVGLGENGAAALTAGALWSVPDQVFFGARFLSFREELSTMASDSGETVCSIPGVLACCDTQHIAALIAPRRCTVVELGCHSAVEMRAHFRWTSELYRVLGSADGFSVAEDSLS